MYRRGAQGVLSLASGHAFGRLPERRQSCVWLVAWPVACVAW